MDIKSLKDAGVRRVMDIEEACYKYELQHRKLAYKALLRLHDSHSLEIDPKDKKAVYYSENGYGYIEKTKSNGLILIDGGRVKNLEIGTFFIPGVQSEKNIDVYILDKDPCKVYDHIYFNNDFTTPLPAPDFPTARKEIIPLTKESRVYERKGKVNTNLQNALSHITFGCYLKDNKIKVKKGAKGQESTEPKQ